ncbi:ethylene-responsive transcription factor RAP2-13-like [Salvia splendens]|uniref:ethylene-responsive transcription factor RAP2-13-like n=1 Tax=Salvia splendens TaxID=180675 RepID=UPI001C2687A2|nr:ethylene-responsive transcription factor RAP2-13-like [Salvia splendens]
MRKWGKWVAEIREPNKRSRIWLGSYSSPVAAARAYYTAFFLLRGPTTRLNFPDCVPEYGHQDLSAAAIRKKATVFISGVDPYAMNFRFPPETSSPKPSPPPRNPNLSKFPELELPDLAGEGLHEGRGGDAERRHELCCRYGGGEREWEAVVDDVVHYSNGIAIATTNLQQWFTDSGYGEVMALKGCDSRESLATAHAVSCRRRRLYREDEDAESADLDAESADLDVESTDGDVELGMIVVDFS